MRSSQRLKRYCSLDQSDIRTDGFEPFSDHFEHLTFQVKKPY